MNKRLALRLLIVIVLTSVVGAFAVKGGAQQPSQSAPSSNKCEIPFPLPSASKIGSTKFEELLYAFLEKGCYKGWVADSQIRNTGPFIGGRSFGTHSAVKVFYSPEVWHWLKDKNRHGDIPDGSMIVKEMFPSPAKQGDTLTGWTAMVKDKNASYDGWYWSYHAPNYAQTNPGLDYPDSGFGLYCLRCHASAEKESTFSTTKNVDGDPISFNILVPTMQPAVDSKDPHSKIAETDPDPTGPFPNPLPDVNPAFTKLYRDMPVVPAHNVLFLPGESYDNVLAPHGKPTGFLTSNQCLGCHSASNENMAFLFLDPKKKTVNLSPYTEWRASMMGLAGRDPIFHSQLEGEKATYPTRTEFFDNTCYRCHGVMGQRQLQTDQNRPFEHNMIYAMPGEPNDKYGALARDGISCSVCHRISKEGLGAKETFTGQFKVDPPNVVNGPFEEPTALPMKNAMGVTPQYGEQIKSSAVCGSCHTVVLPVFDKFGKQLISPDGKPMEFYEQTTYPEWLNSSYQNERKPFDANTARTCQSCHMQTKFRDLPLSYRIANIEDTNYPYTDFRAPDKDITLKVRNDFARHTLLGINQFGLMMFQEFPTVLGIRTADYMYDGAALGLTTSQQSGLELARNETAKIDVSAISKDEKYLQAAVRVENLAGHSFPSGVAFRRAFLTVEFLDATGNVVWASGRTNSAGAIVDGTTENVLPTEFFLDPRSGKQVFQPHYELINSENQVQIYEELVADTEGKITTSFTGLYRPLKNNRLLPKGWRTDGPYAEHTGPHGDAEHDSDYINPAGASGGDTVMYRIPLNDRTQHAVSVRAVLNYQSIPPYWLEARFSTGNGPETARLAYLVSHLSTDKTSVKNWVLSLVCAKRKIGEGVASKCEL